MADRKDAGIVIGRFQVHELHKGHADLISYAVERHDKVIVVLGLSPVRGTRRNPLDFESRRQLILESFPGVTVLYIKDQPSDIGWSSKLDSLVSDMLGPSQKAVLYGSRDSFISHYSGKYPTVSVEAKDIVSGTAVRESLSAYPRASKDFRAGAIWQSFNRFPTSFQAVDIAVFNGSEVLVGKKAGESRYRFIGGFVSPEDISLESAARRELMEEAGGFEVSELRYAGSYRINDWRYEQEVDKIMTCLFFCDYLHGRPTPGDDIDSVHWVDVQMFGAQGAFMEEFVDTHHELACKVYETLVTRRDRRNQVGEMT